jgi:hypothetical protein
MHHFPSISSYNVSFISMSQVGDSQTWPSVTVWYKMQCTFWSKLYLTDPPSMLAAVTKATGDTSSAVGSVFHRLCVHGQFVMGFFQ